ncbi:MAG: ABC transporter ATP-binding protein [Nitrospiraceae bacterium]|nr:ABC transporter ATP-binding protein [Nitrospiraceae bacterium]
MSSGDIAVAVRGLRRTFGDFVAVDSISLEVKKGEVFGFLGPNGAGKSTTIKMLCGLLLPTSGEGTVGGKDIVRETEEIKKNIGYMSQRFSLYEDLTVGQNIDFFSGIYGVAKGRKNERKEWVLEMAGLQDRRSALTGTLPGGYKQRLALGCAILHEPPVLFLDEPTSGVDPISRRNFWDRIYDMSHAGTTVFVTTHYMDEAEYCDRLALIYRGQIIAGGSSADLKERYMKRQVLEIDAEEPVEALEVISRAGLDGVDAAVFGSSLHVVVADEKVAVPELTRILDAAGIGVRKIETILPSLEDVFVTLIETS